MKHFNILQKTLMMIALIAIGYSPASAQLSGDYTIGGTSPDYATLSAAINDLNSNGVSGPVTFMIRDGSYSGTAWRGQINAVTGASATNRITFTSQSNDNSKVTITASTASSTNYVFRFNSASFITVKNLTLQTSSSSYQRMFDFVSLASNDSVVNCVLNGKTSSTSSNAAALVYASGFTGSNNVFIDNVFKQGGTWMYWYGSNTSSGPSNTLLYNNEFTNTSGYYGIYTYYTSGFKLISNSLTRTGSGTYYATYNYYPNDDIEIIGNTITASATGTLYGLHTYFANYYSNNSTDVPKIHDNTVTLTNTSGSTYPIYTYYSKYCTYLNNTIKSTQSTGYIYGYGPLYYNDQSRASNNTIEYNMTSTSSGYIYNYYMVYNGANWADTFTNNTYKVNKVGSGTMYNYLVYYGNTIIKDNDYDIYGGNSTTYNYFYYANGALFKGNKVKSRVNSATHYGAYIYNSTSYSGGTYDGNIFDFSNNSGTLYGIYAYYWSGDKFMNNLVTSKTTGTNYTLRAYYNYNGSYYNNTFHSNATGSSDYVAYLYNSSSSYNLKFKNNLITKATNKGYGLYLYSSNYAETDYNNVYVPGAYTFYQSSPYVNTNSLATWRAATGNDMNSLSYDPGYTDPSGGNYEPNPSSPNSWSVNGRGVHIQGDTMDVAGNPRPKNPEDGVPDIGAYQFTPTSTPPASVAVPATPAANTKQTYTFGQDTVAVIEWGTSVPTTSPVIRQYTGIKANPINAGVGRMFFYTAIDGNDLLYSTKPNVYYKDPWIGNVSSETNSVIAKSSAGNSWLGYNYNNASTDTARNILAPTSDLDTLGNYTGVENARIGIRCVPIPNDFKFTNITKESADGTWASIWNPVGYQVVITPTKGYPGPNAGTQVTSNNISFSGLIEDTKYYVYVRFICGAGDTSSWGLDSFTTLISCHAPTLTLSSLNSDKVVVSWPAVKTAVSYEYVIDKSPVDPSFGTAIKSNSFLASYLSDGTNYYVHVRSNCNSIYAQSPWSTMPFQTWPLSAATVSKESGVNVYPNPATEVLNIEVGGDIANGAVVQLTDVTGKVVILKEVTSNKLTININDLPSGMYMLKYRDDNRTELVKVTKN